MSTDTARARTKRAETNVRKATFEGPTSGRPAWQGARDTDNAHTTDHADACQGAGAVGRSAEDTSVAGMTPSSESDGAGGGSCGLGLLLAQPPDASVPGDTDALRREVHEFMVVLQRGMDYPREYVSGLVDRMAEAVKDGSLCRAEDGPDDRVDMSLVSVMMSSESSGQLAVRGEVDSSVRAHRSGTDVSEVSAERQLW